MTHSSSPRPLEILNKQCAEHQGEWMVRIRIHPMDKDLLVEDLKAAGFKQEPGIAANGYGSLNGVPVVKDENCMEGPVIDWKPAPNFEADIALLKKYMRD